jgi:hypothetical protein
VRRVRRPCREQGQRVPRAPGPEPAVASCWWCCAVTQVIDLRHTPQPTAPRDGGARRGGRRASDAPVRWRSVTSSVTPPPSAAWRATVVPGRRRHVRVRVRGAVPRFIAAWGMGVPGSIPVGAAPSTRGVRPRPGLSDAVLPPVVEPPRGSQHRARRPGSTPVGKGKKPVPRRRPVRDKSCQQGPLVGKNCQTLALGFSSWQQRRSWPQRWTPSWPRTCRCCRCRVCRSGTRRWRRRCSGSPASAVPCWPSCRRAPVGCCRPRTASRDRCPAGWPRPRVTAHRRPAGCCESRRPCRPGCRGWRRRCWTGMSRSCAPRC